VEGEFDPRSRLRGGFVSFHVDQAVPCGLSSFPNCILASCWVARLIGCWVARLIGCFVDLGLLGRQRVRREERMRG
jgi:hypothetical protein